MGKANKKEGALIPIACHVSHYCWDGHPAAKIGIRHRNVLILPPILEMKQTFKTIQKVRLAPS